MDIESINIVPALEKVIVVYTDGSKVETTLDQTLGYLENLATQNDVTLGDLSVNATPYTQNGTDYFNCHIFFT